VIDKPRVLAGAVLLVLIALFTYAVTTRSTLGGGAPRYYPPTDESKRAYARLAERAAAARAARAAQATRAPAAPAR
jgi:hypothetical protein